MAKADQPTVDTSALNLYQKLAAITGEIGLIAKDGKNTQQSYSFIEYASVAARLRELYSKYHVDFLPSMGERIERPLAGGKGVSVLIRFTLTFTNADKPAEAQTAEWEGEASDYGDKGTNKAATAAVKYFQMRKFNISEKGDDPDAETPDGVAVSANISPAMIQPNQLKHVMALFTGLGITDHDKRLEIASAVAKRPVESVNDLTMAEARRIITALEAKAASAEHQSEVPDQTPTDPDPPAELPVIWVIPDFPDSKFATIQQHKLIKKWLEFLAAERPDLAQDFVQRTISKEKVGTGGEAMQVIHALADALNGLGGTEKAA